MCSEPVKATLIFDEIQERLDFGAESSGCGFWEWSAEEDLLTVDRASATRFGVAPSAMNTRIFESIIHADDLARFQERVALSCDVPSTVRIRMLPADGSYLVVDAILKARDTAADGRRRTMMTTREADDAAVRSDETLLDRISLAIGSAGVHCSEYSFVENRFTWFDHPLDANGDLLPEDQSAVLQATLKAVADGAETLVSYIRRREGDGQIRHFKLHQRFFRDATGKALRSMGTTRDVTDELIAQKALREQTELFRETQRRLNRTSLSLQEGHWELELPTGRHWASTSYLKLLGYADDSTDLEHVSQVTARLHPEDQASVHAATVAHLEGGPPYSIEARMRSLDGSYRWYRLRGVAERDAEGRPLRLSGSINDIHKQHEAEDALRNAEGRFSRAIHGTQDGLWEVDLDRESMWLSPRLSELLGYADGELSDSQHVLRELVHPEDVPGTDTLIAECARLGQNIDFEVRMRTKGGVYRWYRMRGIPPQQYATEGRRSSGSMQDVTDARLARDKLIQATEDAQAANRAKSGFLANVSHEIRTPMNGIIGMTRLLLDTALDPVQRDYTDTIRSSADSLLTVINDLLDFSKIEAGKLDIEMLEMDLPANIEDVATIMSFQAAAKNLELIVNVHPDVPSHVRGDPQRIRQCVINLLGNAIKFTHSGEIVCEVGVVESSNPGATLEVRFAVHDTGIGISAGILDTLFQPFTQADISTTRHYGGTGLGLSIVHRLVEMMGGKTGAESRVGKGSTFWFTLPMVRTDAPSEVAVRSPRVTRRVLIVDDNQTNRRVLESQLAYAGYAVTLAKNGDEALSALRSSKAAGTSIDVALIDFQMPGMDGGELGRRIISDSQLSSTRVVLLTSMDVQGDVARFAALGFAGYLSKPVRMRDLLGSLERVLLREAGAWHLQTQPIVTNNGAVEHATPERFSGKVLIVEDNVVNQKVARRFLERMGCEVVLAENGEQGVSACAQNAFDLVLMDVQMPIMDGYTATRQIRDREIAPARLPIVALTANAMAGQLEKCLEAGMDALLTKPLDIERLEEALGRFGLSRASARPVDSDKLSEMTAGDENFARDLLHTFLQNSAALSAQIDKCLALDDRRQLEHAAHQLAGASANVHAAPLRALCSKLESAAADMTVEALRALTAELNSELLRVRDALLAADTRAAATLRVNRL